MSAYHEQLRSRFAALGLIVALMLLALLVRLWTMQVLSGRSYAAKAENNRVREVTLTAPRGRIFDRNGVPLVTDRAALAVSVDPADESVHTLIVHQQSADKTDDPTKAQIEQRFGALGKLLGMSAQDIWAKVYDSKLEALQPRVVAIDVPVTVASWISEHQTDFPGVSVGEIAVREYPQGSVAAHILGYTGQISDAQLKAAGTNSGYQAGDVVGKTGVEAEYENVLQGDKGVRRIEVNAAGQPQRVVSEQAAVAGRDVKLTIDVKVQRVAEKALADALVEAHQQGFNKARAGAAVALDVKTGDVLAMASAPTYDPSLFLGAITDKEWQKLTSKTSDYPLNNRAIMSAYPPASTFKAVTGLAGLHYGVTYANKVYECHGKWTGMGTQWAKWCWDHAGHGAITFMGGIRESCDTVFYEIGYDFYKRKKEELQSFARHLGLGKKTGIDLPGEVDGRVPDAAWKKAFNKNYPEYQMWLPGDTVNMSIGQGDLLATPLQMASVYAGIANGGKVMRPHVLLSVLDSNGKAARTYRPVVNEKMPSSAGDLDVMRRALVEAATSGTAAGAMKGLGVTVAAKTGTGQVAGKDDYAWYLCFAPADAPKYAVAVLVEQGGHGGSVAGPAARQIVAQLLGLKVEQVHTTDNSR